MYTHVAERSQHSKRIVIVRTDRLGDVILSLPMLPLLRRRFPDSHIAMLLRKYPAELVRDNQYLDEILLYDDGERLIPFKEMLKTIRSRGFDTAVIVHPTPRLAWLMFRAGVPLRIGTGYRFYSALFNGRVFEHRKVAERHEVEYNLNLLKPLGCSVTEKPRFELVIPPAVETRIDDLFRSLSIDRGKEIIVVHPGTGNSSKEWPAEYFGRLAARLQAGRDARIIVTGTKEEEEKVSQILRLAKGKTFSLAGRLSLKELAAVIGRADLFVSNSTGPLHIAVAVGTPVVCMFPRIRPMSAERWGPYTSRRRVLVPDRPEDCTKCAGRRDSPCECMMSISVDEAYAAACSLLAECRTGESVPNG